MLDDFTGLAVLLIMAGVTVYTRAPAHWQCRLGLILLTFGLIPLAIALACILKQPAVMVPAAMVLGGYFTRQLRA